MASDPRVGSARDNSTSPGISRLAQGSNSSSINGLLATLIPVTVYATVCLLFFIVLRRKCPRVYSPRAKLKCIPPDERPPELPNGWFNWIMPFYKIPDTYVLNHVSIDGYLFLRYLRILGVIMLFGCCLTWPILLPVNALGTNDGTGLDILSIGNVSDPMMYYAHAIVAWIFFGFILITIYRECIYFVNLRQAYLASPYYARRLSSKTVLFTSIPMQYLEEAKLRKLLGDSVRRVWIGRESGDLDKLIKERRQTVERLENAEIELIRMANLAKSRMDQQQNPPRRKWWQQVFRRSSKEDVKSTATTNSDTSTNATDDEPGTEAKDVQITFQPPLPDVNGSVAAQYISHRLRPHHRPLANYGRRVDTIKWTRTRLKKLNYEIRKTRRHLILERGALIPAAFVEFDSQEEAQIAYQALPHHRPFHMSPRYIGVRPFEIIWDSLSMQWREIAIRRFFVKVFIAVLIIFWAIPCGFVGMVTNIEYVATKVPFLYWLLDLPDALLGLIQGLLPAVALMWLMSIVPGIMRRCAVMAGAPTLTLIELHSQTSYFIFQVVQVFLVTTLTSAVSATLTQVLENPPSATTLLSSNLPKASNFYLSFFFVQCMAQGATSLLHLLDLYKFQIVQSYIPNPRRRQTRWNRLQRIHWGGVFPIFTNLGVIALTYSCIAPIVLGFAAIGVWFVHSAYRYNLLYAYDSEIDTKGLVYPRALLQTLTGVYFALLCLVGLFAIRAAIGPVVMTIGLLILTILVQVSLHDALGPLLDKLPRTLAAENEDENYNTYVANAQILENNGQPLDYFDFLEDRLVHREPEEPEIVHEPGATRPIEGVEAARETVSSEVGTKLKAKFENHHVASELLVNWKIFVGWLAPDPTKKPNFFKKWLYPHVYCDYRILRQMMPPDLQTAEYSDETERIIYYPPTFAQQQPRIWIPRDAAGVSAQEVKHTGKVIRITDEGAILDERGRIVVDYDAVEDDDQIQYWRY